MRLRGSQFRKARAVHAELAIATLKRRATLIAVVGAAEDRLRARVRGVEQGAAAPRAIGTLVITFAQGRDAGVYRATKSTCGRTSLIFLAIQADLTFVVPALISRPGSNPSAITDKR